ncbi:hypothetical protein GQ607_016130 [Colletotrichum asianum]|uniref:Uncharacterized protein n=1 Tax=Colletotrichum asianum TaxID=702518 RepID=A0A8H3ZEZ7_9PEZI|nr:hypothetical protein GQ607_016130 [Colletotrichum asianum]
MLVLDLPYSYPYIDRHLNHSLHDQMRLGPFVERFHHSTPRSFLSTRLTLCLSRGEDLPYLLLSSLAPSLPPSLPFFPCPTLSCPSLPLPLDSFSSRRKTQDRRPRGLGTA